MHLIQFCIQLKSDDSVFQLLTIWLRFFASFPINIDFIRAVYCFYLRMLLCLRHCTLSGSSFKANRKKHHFPRMSVAQPFNKNRFFFMMACHKIYDWYNVFLCDCFAYFINICNAKKRNERNGQTYTYNMVDRKCEIQYMTMNGMIFDKTERINKSEPLTSKTHQFTINFRSLMKNSCGWLVCNIRVSCEWLLLLLYEYQQHFIAIKNAWLRSEITKPLYTKYMITPNKIASTFGVRNVK